MKNRGQRDKFCKKIMKIWVIASTEYKYNMPDLFLMDEEGNYYGVSEWSYAKFNGYPKDVNYWRTANCSDDGRFFNIDIVELTEEQVFDFDRITKEYCKLYAESPEFSEKYPERDTYRSKKDYNQAVSDYEARYRKYIKDCNVEYYVRRKRELWDKRTKLFLTFSKKVAETIADNIL